ncbi:histidine kinase [Skermanella stibiiresistens SB22]|jgi:DNA-binding response OmpR family regulator|uniref:Histidine kinase n=1 Tax=Skermanella stibiiresistens SB22 TaxID=1385369 RepID=W9H8H2_9PROT|nr:response regulator [Skermanella stibiiresistens]EWY42550.1 histidine kinase [Skermanella stibiiresistens SB22]
MAHILLIEDMAGVRDALDVVLTFAGHRIDTARDGEEGLAKVKAGSHDLVICDIVMPRKDGTTVIIEAKAARPALPILAVSGGAGGVTAKQALLVAAATADRTLEKPFSRDDLLTAVRELLPSNT